MKLESEPVVVGAVGKVKIQPLLRDFQAEGESPALGLFHGAAFSTALLPTNSAKEPKVLSYWPREDETVETWAKKAYRLGSNWRQTCASSGTVPVEVRNRWNAARELLKKVSFGASDNLKLYQLLLELAAIADEACVGVGLPSFRCNAARTACKTAWAGAAGKLAFFAGLSTNRSRRAAYLTSDPSDQANRATGVSRTPPSPAGRWGCLGRHLSRV